MQTHRLLGINGVSLVLALLANFALLLNMARRLSFNIAQPVTIIGWYISSFILIGLVASMNSDRNKFPGRALTQPFYYAIMAALVYFIVATLMTLTVYGALKGHYSRQFQLTTSQRTLMLQTIAFMVYLLGGAGVFARVEGWKFADSVYWADYTLLTVGIGDLAPMTHTGRSLLIPYAIGGIVILGLVIGSIRSLVLERGKKKLDSRMIEKQREKYLKRMKKQDDTARLKPVESQKQSEEVGMTEYQRRKKEFQLMREVQNHAAIRQKWNALLISTTVTLVLWFVGAVIFWKAEYEQGWTYFGGLYFAYVSLLTIGYGDFRPFSNSGKAFFVFWSLLIVPALTILISNMGDTVVKAIRDLTLYLGEFTVLPGEAGVRTRIRQAARNLKSRDFLKQKDESMMDEPPGLLGEKEGDDDSEKQASGARGNAADRIATQLEETELAEAEDAKKHGDKLGEDMHYYHYLLVKEIRTVFKHLNESPPRKYAFEEWVWFLKLMGEDESSADVHRTAPIKVKHPETMQPDFQQGQTDRNDEQKREWSWVGNRSPLMGEQAEAEWVLERLSMTLEKALKKESEKNRETLPSGPTGAPEPTEDEKSDGEKKQ